tara:strand:- start:24083 stop:24448 length:366 start_codon:yes stop_codon:yes gene_type:complete
MLFQIEIQVEKFTDNQLEQELILQLLEVQIHVLLRELIEKRLQTHNLAENNTIEEKQQQIKILKIALNVQDLQRAAILPLEVIVHLDLILGHQIAAHPVEEVHPVEAHLAEVQDVIKNKKS